MMRTAKKIICTYGWKSEIRLLRLSEALGTLETLEPLGTTGTVLMLVRRRVDDVCPLGGTNEEVAGGEYVLPP
jgi:hypothetical protein